MTDYQILVIGSGPAGTAAAVTAAGYGLRTAVISDERAGGTCLNRGCIPTKTLLYASGLVRESENGEEKGFLGRHSSVNLKGLFEYKESVVKTLSDSTEKQFQTLGIDLFRGKATLLADGSVKISPSGADSPQSSKVLTADHIILATGSIPAFPPIPGIHSPHVLTSDDVLKGEDHLPSSVLIIGGGVIGVELATYYSDLKVPVTIVEGQKQILPAMDRDIAQNLSRIMKQANVTICTDASVKEIRDLKNGAEVDFLMRGSVTTAYAETVICAVGRRPNTQGLFGDGCSVSMEGNRVAVDENYRTSLPHVYAVGDLSSKVQLAHAATAQGKDCARMIADHAALRTRSSIPACIFTRPEIAVVGISEQQAKKQGICTAAGKAVLYSNARTLISGTGRSFMKVIADKEDGRILGASLMCSHATEMISELSEAIDNGLTVSQMLRVIRPHPTFHEALTDALEDLDRKLESGCDPGLRPGAGGSGG